MNPPVWVAFVLAGAAGASLRHLVDGFVADRTEGTFPWGTFLVNASGALLVGFLTGLALYRGFPEAPRLVLGGGFCGAYTTFSTFTFETVRLVEGGAVSHAVGNALGTLLTCAAAASAGIGLAALL